MRSANRFQELLPLPELDGASTQSHKCSKISYSRNFLLSVGMTERCKNLPGDFDSSMLHEFEDASAGLLMTPSDSDSKHSKSLSRGLMQNPFNDGLLGSGGCMTIPSSSKIQGSNGCDLLNKCEKPYRPPHFYKIMSHSGRESNDSCNEETSGSDFLSCERAKEERSRKDSFQMMRKDQHQVIQENLNKPLDGPKSEDSVVPPASYGGSSKDLLATPILSFRQSTGTNPSTNSSLTEVSNTDGKEIQPEKSSEFNEQLHETSNGNPEELNQFGKPAMIREVYTCKDHDHEKHPNEHDHGHGLGLGVSHGEDGQFKSSIDHTSSLKLSSDKLHNISGNRNTSRFDSCLPHNLIFGTGLTEDQVDLNKNKDHHSVSSDDTQPDEFADEYHLPDEDSLFTFDYIVPQDSSCEPDLLASCTTQADLTWKLSALSFPSGNHKPTQSGMETYNIYAQQWSPQVPYLHPQGPPQGHRSSKTKMDSRPNPDNWYPRNVPPYPLQQPPFSALSVSPVNYPQYDQMPLPFIFPPSYYGMPNPDPGFGAYNNQVSFNQLYKNENPRALAKRCLFGKQW